LAVAREVECHAPMELRCGSALRATMLLQIYFALSPADYARFVPVWIEALERDTPLALEPLLAPGWQGRNPLANVVREHLKRNFAGERIEKFVAAVEARRHKVTTEFYAEALAFMTKDASADDAEGCDDDFDDSY
jgi:hypothetical protein